MALIYLMHGFNVGDAGQGTTGRLVTELVRMGHMVRQPNYGHFGLIQTRLCNEGVARVLSNLAEPGAVAIGHSNACTILHRAAWYGAPFSKMFFINPALDRDAQLAPQVEQLNVYYSKNDTAVRMSRWRPWSRWGDMGAVGYRGPVDDRIANFDEEAMVSREGKFHVEHSDMLKDSHHRQILLKHIGSFL